MKLFQAKKVKNIINKYNNNLFSELNNNIDTLIDAFTIYYGEEYRNSISEKIKNIYFFTFISSNIIDLMKEGYNNLTSSQKDDYKDLKIIINYYSNKKNLIKIYEGKGSLTGNFRKQIRNAIKENSNTFAFQISNIDIEHNPIYTIFLGIGIDDQAIIHEINHVVTDSILAYIQNDDSKLELIEKIGIANSISLDTDEAMEELLNDKSAYDITTIFHKLGGHISNYNLYSINTYSMLFPLINKFYYKYINLIKKARISDNQNIIYTEIDKNKFEIYKKFITEEINYVYKNNKISQNAITKANELITNLKKENNFKQYINITNQININEINYEETKSKRR